MTSLVPKGMYRLRSGDSNSPNAYLVRETNASGSVVVAQLDASSDSQKVCIHHFFHCAFLQSPSTQWDISPAADGDYTITAFGNNRHILRTDSASELVCSPTRRNVTWTIEPRGKNIYVFDFAFHPNFNPFILD
jgi:hypothetical protein